MIPSPKKPNLKFSTLVSRISWGYVILFAVWILLRLVFFDSLWWLAIIYIFVLYIFVPLLLLLPFALLWHQWRLLFGLGFPLGVFIAFYGSLFLPQLPRGADETVQAEITVISFNMLFSNEFIKFAHEWYTRRANEVTYLRSLIQQRRLPTIMLCDCNYVDTSQAYARTQEVMKDSFRKVGWGFGHTVRGQFFGLGRIDFIWYTKELKALKAWVAEGGGSDHLPVVARLEI
ncbi:hypothetical protein DSM106972_070420 [Dulcicalothrix desertica PCC 7102]|uniref:Endonuclease/exonuclease/phosphatase domain-containing protein n=1 Tax=Dulcicalothrix desertica PCC 7102 TaxID=232991 RepID=A0A3S1CE60_9CYAN|nr:hypothetical protein [Dulcicalothrix desertica]RUT01036.1 hypothetical protein DSM106972_070420 [Dulcicalothrix desertica PCC 7102]TWH39190.1 hypothetical protein CAL7102_08403 [Dulcicalothrix desertica PCC 7102]